MMGEVVDGGSVRKQQGLNSKERKDFMKEARSRYECENCKGVFGQQKQMKRL
jgi:hypothetical protein